MFEQQIHKLYHTSLVLLDFTKQNIKIKGKLQLTSKANKPISFPLTKSYQQPHQYLAKPKNLLHFQLNDSQSRKFKIDNDATYATIARKSTPPGHRCKHLFIFDCRYEEEMKEEEMELESQEKVTEISLHAIIGTSTP